jgi:hypothetical protein
MNIKTIHKFKGHGHVIDEFVCVTKLHVIEVVARLESAFEVKNEAFLFSMGIDFDIIEEILKDKTYLESIEHDTFRQGSKSGILIKMNFVNKVNRKKEEIKLSKYLFYRLNSPQLD